MIMGEVAELGPGCHVLHLLAFPGGRGRRSAAAARAPGDCGCAGLSAAVKRGLSIAPAMMRSRALNRATAAMKPMIALGSLQDWLSGGPGAGSNPMGVRGMWRGCQLMHRRALDDQRRFTLHVPMRTLKAEIPGEVAEHGPGCDAMHLLAFLGGRGRRAAAAVRALGDEDGAGLSGAGERSLPVAPAMMR